MEVNIELAKRLLKEQYFINGDNKIRTQNPIRVEDLAFIMQKYTDEQLTIHSVIVPKGTLFCECISRIGVDGEEHGKWTCHKWHTDS